MTKQEIKDAIRQNEQAIERTVKENPTFVLNEIIGNLEKSNAYLRLVCGETKHEFVNGFCRWCGTKEERDD